MNPVFPVVETSQQMTGAVASGTLRKSQLSRGRLIHLSLLAEGQGIVNLTIPAGGSIGKNELGGSKTPDSDRARCCNGRVGKSPMWRVELVGTDPYSSARDFDCTGAIPGCSIQTSGLLTR